jgi:hypothetical protein
MQAVQEYLQLLESGQRPQPEELLRRYPDLAGPLAQCLDGLELVHKAASREKQSLSGRTGEPGGFLPVNPLGDFQILREIGRGGMGVVYEAVQLSLGRRVALKVLPFAAGYDAKQLQRFRTEAQAAAQLHHTNIVPVFAVGCERGVHFYAMQLIDGQSLAVLIQELRHHHRPELPEPDPNVPRTTVDEPSGPGLPLAPAHGQETASALATALSTQRSSRPTDYYRRIAALLKQAAEALEYAHQYGIVHRDIKPANLLLDQRGCLWITDFGLAQVQADAALTLTGDLIGTLRYMSPEQASGQRSLLDHRTDVYSLGATLYELATLEPIFGGKNRQALLQQILQDEPRSPRAIVKGIPVELETILLKAINKNPQDRYAAAQAFADDLQRFLDDKPILARRPTVIDRARKWSRRHPSIVGAGVVLLLICIAGLLINNRMIATEQAKTARRAEEAEARFQLARRSVDEMIRIADEELSNEPMQQIPRQRLLEAALAYYQEFIEQRSGDANAQAELEITRDRVKTILADLAMMQGAWQHLLLREPAVQDELKLTEDQSRRVIEALKDIGTGPRRGPLPADAKQRFQRILDEVKGHEAAITSILSADQVRRLRQIALQARGPMAFRQPDVIAALKLTAEQRDQIRAMEGEFGRLDSHRTGESPPGPPGKARQGPPRPQLDQILALLTEEQRQQWRDMTGEPFDGPTLRFLPGPRPAGPPPPGDRPPGPPR